MIDFDRSEKDHSSRFHVRRVFTQPGSKAASSLERRMSAFASSGHAAGKAVCDKRQLQTDARRRRHLNRFPTWYDKEWKIVGGGQFSDYRKASFVVSVESGWRLSCRLRSTCNRISVLPGAGDGRQRRRKQGNPSKGCGSDSSGGRSLYGRASASRGRTAGERRSPEPAGCSLRWRIAIGRSYIERAGFACRLGIYRPGARTH